MRPPGPGHVRLAAFAFKLTQATYAILNINTPNQVLTFFLRDGVKHVAKTFFFLNFRSFGAEQGLVDPV